MDSDIGSGDFEIREPGGDSSSDPIWEGEDESCKPTGRGLRDFDIQEPEDDVPSHLVIAEEIEVWVEVSREKARQTLSYWNVMLCIAWDPFGFIVFLFFLEKFGF